MKKYINKRKQQKSQINTHTHTQKKEQVKVKIELQISIMYVRGITPQGEEMKTLRFADYDIVILAE